MKLTPTQKTMLLHFAGKAKHGLFCNHARRAESFLRSVGLAEGYYFAGIVCGEPKTCYGTRLTEEGKKLAEQVA